MALRLRRGTDAERQLITPVEGELIYTTDTKLLYVGDGSTAGGTLVTGAGGGGSTTLDELTDTDLTGAANNDVLTFNAGTNKWEAVTVPGVGILSLNDLNDVFLPTSPNNGDILRYDGINFTAGSVTDIFQEQQNYKINIVGDDSTILVDTDTNTFTGSFVGDGSGLTNIPGVGIPVIELDDLNDVFLPFPPKNGDILRYDGINFTASPVTDIFQEQQNYKINIVGDDSTIIIDTYTNNVTGNFFGDLIGDVTGDVLGNVTGNVIGYLTGDMTGSVFGDDSTLIVDSVNNQISGRVNTNRINSSTTGPIELQNDFRTPVQIKAVTDGNPGGFPYTEYLSIKGTFLTPESVAAGDIVGGWKITGYDAAAELGKSTTVMASRLMADAVITDTSPNSLTSIVVSGGGTNTSSFDFYGNGQFKSPGAITPGVYADADARDAAITTPTAGMMVFVTDIAKFQGYDGSAWVNLN